MYFLASEALKPPLPLMIWFYVNTNSNYPRMPKPTPNLEVKGEKSVSITNLKGWLKYK